jgi:Zn-finger nucleic acid-binding protein
MGWLQSLKDMLNRDATAGMAQFDCPVCRGTRLRETRLGDYGKVILDVCPRCHGVWLEKGELDRLDGSPWTNVEEHEFHQADGDHKAADCPKCAVALTPLSPGDCPEVIVDSCP